MSKRIEAKHSIVVALPVRQCQRLFTPAGEELWIDEWRPTYHHPLCGRTERGMVFSTGTGDDHTLWSLVDFETGPRYYARYSRVTPALRSGYVEVECTPMSERETFVEVRYQLTALTAAGEQSLSAYEPAPFQAMIEEWGALIEARRPFLADAVVR